MDNWKKVGTLNEFNVNNQWLIEIENRPIALFKYDNNFYALKNSCLHQGFSLAEGHLKSYMVECPLHGWVYDIRDGKCLSVMDRYTIFYELRIKDNNLEINIELNS